MKWHVLFIVFMVSFSSIAQKKKWTLLECVELAYENNITIEQFELDLESANIDKSDALGNFLPTLNGTVSASESSGLVLDPQTNSNVSGQILSGSGSLNSGLLLFNGLRNIHTLNRAKINAIANQYRLNDLKDDIALNVANAYLQVISNKESLKVFQAQYAVTEQDLKRTKELVDAGVLPKGDLLEIEATAATQEQQIVSGEGNVLISLIGLAQLLQITDYENFDVADEEFDIPISNILENSPKTIFQKAMTFRNDIKFSQSSVELAEKDLQIAKSANYPTLSAFFNYNTFASDQFGLSTVRNPNEDPTDPLDDFILDDNGQPVLVAFRPDFIAQLERNDGIAYGLQLNVPIFNGFSTRNNVRRSQVNVEQARLQFEQTKLELENAINQAYVDVTTFHKAYEAAVKTLEARRLSYNYAKERYDVGLMNAFDFSQAQSRVDNAEADVIRTKYDYIFRLKILEFYFGIPISLD